MDEVCIKAKRLLKKGDYSFLGAYGNVGWNEMRYCKLCGDWHLSRHIKSIIDGEI